jgi:anti-sigma regulatory factor (Ser/Thr protein kinase)
LVAVRKLVQRWVERQGMTGLAHYRFVVAVNEITTNAVRHGGGRGRLALWCVDDQIYCRVSDGGGGMPDRLRTEPPSPRTPHGRGLWLARAGCDRLTVRREGGGTAVTLSVRVA